MIVNNRLLAEFRNLLLFPFRLIDLFMVGGGMEHRSLCLHISKSKFIIMTESHPPHGQMPKRVGDRMEENYNYENAERPDKWLR